MCTRFPSFRPTYSFSGVPPGFRVDVNVDLSDGNGLNVDISTNFIYRVIQVQSHSAQGFHDFPILT